MVGLSIIGSARHVSAIEVVAKKVLSTTGSDRATRYVQSNKIITRDGVSHVSWLDWLSDSKIASFDMSSSNWSANTKIGTGVDNHGGPAIAFDSDGYLHAIFGPHSGPFQYAVSALPNDSSSWITQPGMGSFATYPSFVIDNDDTVHLTYRGGPSSSDLRLVYQQLPKGGTWSAPHYLADAPIGYSGYAHYHNSMAIGPDGALHVAFDIYHFGSPYDRATGAGHLMSLDGGTTWQTAEGLVMSQVVRPDSNVFFRTTNAPFGLTTNNVAVDSLGNPWITVLDYDSNPYSTSYLYHHDGNDWQSYKVDDLLPSEYAGNRFSWDFTVGLDSDDGVYIAGVMNGNVAVLYSPNPTETPFELLIVDRARSGFSPVGVSIERFVGHNSVGVPRISYSSGSEGSPSTVFTAQLGRESEPGDRTWALTGSGSFLQGSSWTPSTAPNGAEFRAVLGPSILAPSTLIIDSPVTVNALSFESQHTYALAGTGRINFAGSDAGIVIAEGNHEIQVKVTLLNDTSVDAVNGQLDFNNQVDLAGNLLTLIGDVHFNNQIIDSVGGGGVLNVGTLAASGTTSITGDLFSHGTLDINLAGSAAGGASTLDIAGTATLQGFVRVSGLDGNRPAANLSVLHASDGIRLSGPLELDGSSAASFRGVRIVGNSLVLLAVPEPAALSCTMLGILISGVYLQGRGITPRSAPKERASSGHNTTEAAWRATHSQEFGI